MLQNVSLYEIHVNSYKINMYSILIDIILSHVKLTLAPLNMIPCVDNQYCCGVFG